ncbi:hypothetical protein N7537_001076 [Penicillium hordei]|uniref:Uncharacterized protein n=1 Tax=Penicillium hordei TaxID=40994 RepID=A0AAD6H7X2_9EURO|nr:uncharacterized protein N7537_001076 [Penicillium hordei]KAJ5615962.1 hypothetical protein N7537_001076 [Penicillium hordei]
MTALTLLLSMPKALQSTMSTYAIANSLPEGALEFHFEACFISLLLISQGVRGVVWWVKFENAHSHHEPPIHSLSKSLRFQRKKRTRYLGHVTFHIHDCTYQGYHLMT